MRPSDEFSFSWSSDRSLRIVGSRAELHALHEGLRRAPVIDLVDLVLTSAALTLIANPSTAPETVEESVRNAIFALNADDAPASVPRVIEIPACYELPFAPDLPDLARAAALSEAEFARRHAETIYTADFLGFSPGFAYLSGLPHALAAPRLSTPRRQVPSGSIGIAGTQTGVYPQAMPGGWRLIARTPIRLFDPARTPPALIAPGDQVRFVPIDRDTFDHLNEHPTQVAVPTSPPATHAGAAVRVVDPGFGITIQDLGRFGHGGLGVSSSGAADSMSLRIGNRLLGNPEGAAGLELTLAGAVLHFERAVQICLTGTHLPVFAEPAPSTALPFWRPIDLAAGTTLRFLRARSAHRSTPHIAPRPGCRTYLCIDGGLLPKPVLGSRSTHARTGLGPASLRAGDILPIGEPNSSCSRHPLIDADALRTLLHGLARATLRITPHPHAEHLPGVLEPLTARQWTISPHSDRIGLRLAGQTITGLDAAATSGTIPSEAMLRGFIQLPPNGLPIILGADCSPTGGYVVPAGVIAADLDALGQLLPGTTLRFQVVTRAEARRIFVDRERLLNQALPLHG